MKALGFSGHFVDDRLVGENRDIRPDVLVDFKEQIGETDEVKREGLQQLRELLQGETDLQARTDDDFLLRFLRCRYYRVLDAFWSIKSYYAVRRDYPELYRRLRPVYLKHLFRYNCIMLLPQLDPRGSPVLIFQVEKYDPSVVTTEEGIRTVLLAAELFFLDAIVQYRGFVLVVDCNGAGFHQLRANPPHKLIRYSRLAQRALPLNLRNIHFVNESRVIDIAFAIIRPIIPRRMQKRIHFHGSDLTSLHRFIPTDILPEEYGGIASPVDMKGCIEHLSNSDDLFPENEKYGYVTSTEGLVSA